MKRPVILCVDDEKIVLTSLKEQLKRPFGKQFSIETVESAEEALEIFQDLLTEETEVPLVITDHIMPGIKGDELLIRIHRLHPDVRKVLLTGQANGDAVGNAVNNANLYRYISKPWEEEDLVLTIREATKSYFQSRRIKEQERQYRGLVESLNVGVYRTTGDGGKFLQANPAIAQIFGYDSLEEFMQSSISELSQNPEELEQSLEMVRDLGHCKELEIEMHKRDGTPIWVSFSITVHYEVTKSQRRVKWMDGVIEDVTERKRAREHLIKLNLAYQRFVPHEFLMTLGKENILDVKLNDQVQKKMTILFSDIRLFSTLSESMTPEENFRFINSYLSHMGPLVRENHGFIDKYIGDAIMALFDREADDAVSAAIVMLIRLISYNQGRKRARYIPIEIGIGINTGNLILGTLGETNRMEGTVISDAVNAASRLEGLTKKYGVPLLISEHTFHELKNPERYSIRFIDRVRVKGKADPISVYEVFDTDPPELLKLKLANKKLFEKAMYHLHFGEVNDGYDLLQQYASENPLDTVAQIHIQRFKKSDRVYLEGKDRNRLIWNQELSIGISQLDEQHIQLFEQINLLMETILQNRGEVEFVMVLSDFKECTEVHFAAEEELMKRYGYPGCDHHSTLHKKYRENRDKFTQVVQQMGYRGKEEGLYLLLRIQHLIADSFLNHVAVADRVFGNFLDKSSSKREFL